MSITCQCPLAEALPKIPNAACPVSFGQIQKVAFQRLRKATGEVNEFKSDSSLITKKASWTACLSAEDGTKIVVSPYINSPADSGGDARSTGGGNDDLGGIPTILGSEPIQFTGSLRAVDQSIIKALKELICEANAGNLGVFLFDENGNIEAIQDETTKTTYRPIPIRSFFVADKVHGNYDAKDSNAIQWSYQPNYSDNLTIVKPEDFNPLTDLVNAE